MYTWVMDTFASVLIPNADRQRFEDDRYDEYVAQEALMSPGSLNERGERGVSYHIFRSTGGISTAFQLTKSCSFSIKTKVRIVCGLFSVSASKFCQEFHHPLFHPYSTETRKGRDEKHHLHSRQPQPSRRPPFHQEQRALLPQALGQDVQQAAGGAGGACGRRRGGGLDAALEHVGGGADGGRHGAGGEGGEHVRLDVVLEGGPREEEALCGGVAEGGWGNVVSLTYIKRV